MKIEIELPDSVIEKVVREAFASDWDVKNRIAKEANRQIAAIDFKPAVSAAVQECMTDVVAKAVREAMETATGKTLKLALKLEAARLQV